MTKFDPNNKEHCAALSAIVQAVAMAVLFCRDSDLVADMLLTSAMSTYLGGVRNLNPEAIRDRGQMDKLSAQMYQHMESIAVKEFAELSAHKN